MALQDFFEELLGEFNEEFDSYSTPNFQKEGDDFIIDAEFPLDEFNEKFHTQFKRMGIETIGGYVCDKMGKIAEKGEVLEIGSHKFEIMGSSLRKVEKIKYSPPNVDLPS